MGIYFGRVPKEKFEIFSNCYCLKKKASNFFLIKADFGCIAGYDDH